MDPSETDNNKLDSAVEEVLQAVEAPFKQAESNYSEYLPSPSKWPGVLKSEYYQILDQPKRLPFFFHPLISKNREVDLSGTKTFFTPHFYLNDERNVPRRFFLNLSAENLAVGAVGGLLVGLSTNHYFQSHGRLANMTPQKWFKGAGGGGASALEKVAAGSMVTMRLAQRAAFGAVLFDVLKRNADLQRDKDDWRSAAFAGGVSGAIFGLRGGLPTSILSAVGFGFCAAIHKILPDLDFGF